LDEHREGGKEWGGLGGKGLISKLKPSRALSVRSNDGRWGRTSLGKKQWVSKKETESRPGERL